MTLVRSFATVGGITLISRITGFGRDILIAGFLGAGIAADAFLIAFQFPNLFRRLFAEGAFSSGFVPIFSKIMEKEGRDKAREFAEEAFAVLASILVVFVVLMVAGMPALLYVIAPGFDRIPGQMEQATELARIAFPYLLFISLVSLQSGVLNALNYFAAAAAVPILLNLTLITALLTAVATSSEPATALALGVFVSGIIQFLWLSWHVRRIGMKLKWTRARLSPRVRLLIHRILPVVFGASLYQVNLLIDKVLATLVSVGAVSWLYFADRVNQLPLGVVGVGIGVALLPLLTREIQAGRAKEALRAQNRAIEISLLFTLPATGGILVLAEPIAAVLFERGAFAVADRAATSAALAAFATGLPAYVLIKALVPGFFGREDTATPVKISIIAMILNLVLNVILMQIIGHVGIALATAIAAWLNAGVLAVTLYLRGHLVPDARLRKRLPRQVIATVIMVAAVWAALTVMVSIVGPIFGTSIKPAGGELIRTLCLAGLIGLGALVYVVAGLILGISSSNNLRTFRRKPDNVSGSSGP